MRLLQKAREAVKKHGWKALVAITLFYLVRDVTLYLILPYLIVRQLGALD